MRKIRIIGGGPGDTAYILPAATEAIQQCDIIIGDRRMLTAFALNLADKRVHEMRRITETLMWLKMQPESLKTGILVSGDPLMYSMYNLVCRTFPGDDIEIIPGISSVQMFAARLGETMDNAKIISGHGREVTAAGLSEAMQSGENLYILCDGKQTPGWIARMLIKMGFSDVQMAVGSRMSYEDEILQCGKPENFLNVTYPILSLVRIKGNFSSDDTNRGNAFASFVRDDAFLRNRTPMTREEIRWIALGKLDLKDNSVLWDIGSGTGSVAIEASRHCPKGKVIAVEQEKEALDILYKNREKMSAGNMQIIEGSAPEILDGMERPTHVFIGGAGGALEPIMDVVCKLGAGIRVMISCVTLETLTAACGFINCRTNLQTPEIMTVRIETARRLGSYHVMDSGHPVTLIWTETCDVKERENVNDRQIM